MPGARDLQRVYAEQLAVAAAADEAGFDCLLVPEHHQLEDGMCPAPFVIAGAVAARTSRIGVGTGVVLPALHNPLHLAEQYAVLDQLSGGRAIAGLGLGRYTARRALTGFGVERESQAETFERHVLQMAGAWRPESPVVPKPAQQAIPLWIGAQRKVGLRRAARIGDAWIGDHYRKRAVIDAMTAVYLQASDDLGRPAQVIVQRDCHVGSRADVERWWPFVQEGTWAFRVYMEDHVRSPWAALDPLPGAVREAGDVDLGGWAVDRAVFGEPEAVVEQLGRYRADWFILRLQHRTGPPLDVVLEQVERLGRLVLPRLRGATVGAR